MLCYDLSKPGPAQVGAISKAQKWKQKYSLLQHPKNPKVRPNWRARGTLWNVSSILSQIIKRIEGGPFGEIFFSEILTMPKKQNERTLWDFATSILSQSSKKLKRGFGEKQFSKKVAQCRKNVKCEPFSLVWYCMLRGKKGQPGSTGIIWRLLKIL